MKRSEERTQFLNDVLITFTEGGIQMVGEVVDKDMFGNANEPSGYNWVSVWYYDQDESVTHEVTIDTIAHAFTVMGKGEVEFLREESRKRLLQSSRENEAGDIDAVDATNIVEIALFGKVVYG